MAGVAGPRYAFPCLIGGQEAWGQPVHWTGYEMGHELCQEEVEDIAAFLQACWRED